MECPFKKISIIGLGLIGGSLAKAFSKYFDKNPYIHAVDPDERTLKTAVTDGVISGFSAVADQNLQDSDIVFICTPITPITSYIEETARFAGPNCIITDTGSTKQSIYNRAAEKNIKYIGGHPMAGSERAGYAASKEFLFENAYYLLTPAPQASGADIDALKTALAAIGAYPLTIDPALHDNSVAVVSHVPHVIAAALVNMVRRLDDKAQTMHTLAAGGFRDITRIASSDPDMWNAICAENKDRILAGLAVFQEILADFAKNLEDSNGNVGKFFDGAKDYRDSFMIKQGGSYLNEYRIFVDVYDKPGMIAAIVTILSINNINIKNIGIVNSREYENGVMQIVFETAANMEKSIDLLKGMNFAVYAG